VNVLNEKVNIETQKKETKQAPSGAKEIKRYSNVAKKVSAKQNGQTGLYAPRGKKQRRQFKLDPNRG
jgi:hypothetical protein